MNDTYGQIMQALMAQYMQPKPVQVDEMQGAGTQQSGVNGGMGTANQFKTGVDWLSIMKDVEKATK